MKYFGIGAHKTGTTSLNEAFKFLGYNCHHEYDSEKLVLDYIDNYTFQLQWTSQHPEVNFYQDSPWNFGDFYKKLYFWNPDAKFILTVRNSKEWFNSLCNWNKNRTNKWWISMWFHRSEYLNIHPEILPHKNQYISIYEHRNYQIQEFFKNKPNQLLVLNLEDDNKWEKLCNFTNDPIPKIDYPYKNKKQ